MSVSGLNHMSYGKLESGECRTLKYENGENPTFTLKSANCNATLSVICKTGMTGLVSRVQPPLFPCLDKTFSNWRKRSNPDGGSLIRVPRNTPGRLIYLF